MSDTQAAKAVYRWPAAVLALTLLLAALVVFYWPTWVALYGVWFESGTYSHGILIFPAVAYLAFHDRDRLAAVRPSPSWLGLLLLAAMLALWYVARIGAVQVVEQFAVVAAIAAALLTTLGWRVTRILAFPIAFMFFAVPVGDVIIPHLMQFTAWFVVGAIELTGIPVYQDGFMISIPRGDFEVAKACSGIRYLIASVSLGTFYAYITFYSWRRRAAFIVLSALLPIAANGIRAFGIVMIAHWSDMKHAVGVDHLVYGWLFFGVVMFVLFLIGGRFRDEPPAAPARERTDDARANATGRALGLAVAASAITLIAFARWLYERARSAAGGSVAAAALPRAVDGWNGPRADARVFAPAFEAHDDLKRGVYTRGVQRVEVAIHSYTGPVNELVHVRNVMVRAKGQRVLAQRAYPLTVGDGNWPMTMSDLFDGRGRRAVLHWYQIEERRTASPSVAKLYEWMAKLRGRPVRRAMVAVSLGVDGEPTDLSVLEEFLAAHALSLAACVSQPQGAACASGPVTP